MEPVSRGEFASVMQAISEKLASCKAETPSVRKTVPLVVGPFAMARAIAGLLRLQGALLIAADTESAAGRAKMTLAFATSGSEGLAVAILCSPTTWTTAYCSLVDVQAIAQGTAHARTALACVTPNGLGQTVGSSALLP